MLKSKILTALIALSFLLLGTAVAFQFLEMQEYHLFQKGK